MSPSLIYALGAMLAVWSSLWLRRFSIVVMLLLAEVLWVLVLIFVAWAAFGGLQVAPLMLAFLIFCFSATELALMLLGLASINVVSSVV